MYYVYGLVCPIRQQVKYIGRTNNIGLRIQTHKTDKYGGKKYLWLSALKSVGMRPQVITFLTTESKEDAIDRETLLINTLDIQLYNSHRKRCEGEPIQRFVFDERSIEINGVKVTSEGTKETMYKILDAKRRADKKREKSINN